MLSDLADLLRRNFRSLTVPLQQSVGPTPTTAQPVLAAWMIAWYLTLCQSGMRIMAISHAALHCIWSRLNRPHLCGTFIVSHSFRNI